MKTIRLLPLLLMYFVSMAFAQSHDHKPAAAAPSDAEKAFTALKSLAGNWEGVMTLNPPIKEMDNAPMRVSLRVASKGHTFVHEMFSAAYDPIKDPGKQDDPFTLFVVENDRLLLTHYCDGDTRPKMVGKLSPDGKFIEFDFLDVTGKVQNGHMYHAKFTLVDADHHIEEWTYKLPNGVMMQARGELKRAAAGGASSGK